MRERGWFCPHWRTAQLQSGVHCSEQQASHALRRPQRLGQAPRVPCLSSDLPQHQCITSTELQPWTFQTCNRFESIHDTWMAGAGIVLLSSWSTVEYL